MIRQRVDLQAIFSEILGNDHVYFQPPPDVKLEYPCIVYHRDFALTFFADNYPYRYGKRYMVTVIDRNPDSPILDRLAQLPMCTFDRAYTADNLNHDVYRLFF